MSKRTKAIWGILLLIGFWIEFWFCKWWDHAGNGPAEAATEHQAVWGMATGLIMIAIVIEIWIVLTIRDDLILEKCGFKYGGDGCNGEKD